MYKVLVHEVIPGCTRLSESFESPDIESPLEAAAVFEEQVRRMKRDGRYGDVYEIIMERGHRGTDRTLAGFWLRDEQCKYQLLRL